MDEIVMSIPDLVQAARASNTAVFQRTDERTAVAIAAAILTEIGDRIDAIDEGRVVVGRLGNFVIRQVEVPDGTTGTQKRVSLRRPMVTK